MQQAFHFDIDTRYDQDDFIVSDANVTAYSYLAKWPNWEDTLLSRALLIYGPHGCGKTHLVHLWKYHAHARFISPEDIYLNQFSELSQCFILEHIEAITDEVAWFHWFNAVLEAQGYIVMTAPCAPSQLHIRLPDLKSRLCAVPSIAIQAPDDTLLAQVLAKQFSDRQLRVSPDVIDYLIPRIERSFASAYAIVKTLDDQALIEKRKITVPFVKSLLSTEA